MKDLFLAPIAEGKGEIEAIPCLLRRIFKQSDIRGDLTVNPVIRVKAESFKRDAEYRNKYLEMAARRAKTRPFGTIVVVLDCEDQCPADLGPKLAEAIRTARPDVPMLVCLAHREFESWFLASARSLGGHGGLPEDLPPPNHPEAIRDAKGWLSQRMPHPYDPTTHQLLFSAVFSLEEAAAGSPSFRRFRLRLLEHFRGA